MTVVQELKDRINAVDFISRHVELKKSGRYFKACCPFHDEKTPSFMVDPNTGKWRCYGACAESGDVIDFYQKINRLEFKEALEQLCQQYGLEIPKSQTAISQTRERWLNMLNEIAGSYHRVLKDYEGAQTARDHLDHRNISQETMDNWILGYAPSSGIVSRLLEKGYQADDLIAIGIAAEGNGHLYDRFRNRLMIPIRDVNKHIVGFGARALDHGQQPKYLNSPESVLFDKSALLYGWHIAKKEMRWHDDLLVIVEGYMDVLACHQAGFKNVVAQMGTALTDKQIALLEKVKTLILCLDGDSAGQDATRRAIENLIPHAKDMDIQIATLPAEQDPDDVIQAGQWESFISHTTPLVDYLIAYETRNLPENASVGRRHEIANKLIPTLWNIEADTARQYNIQQLAHAIGLNPMPLVDMAQRLMASKKQIEVPVQVEAVIDHHAVETYVMACLSQHPDWYYAMFDAFDAVNIEVLNRSDFVRYPDVFQEIVASISTSEPLQPDTVIVSPFPIDQNDLILNAFQLRMQGLNREIDQLMSLGDLDQMLILIRERNLLQEAGV